MTLQDRANQIAVSDTQEEARELMRGLTVPQLREVAKHLSVHLGGAGKSDIVELIISGTVRARQRSQAIRNIEK